jgi:hypothetical protein
MHTLYRFVAPLLALAALAAIVLAGFLYFWPPTATPALVVEEPERVLDDLACGRSYAVEFRVRNSTGQTLRIVGGPCAT